MMMSVKRSTPYHFQISLDNDDVSYMGTIAPKYSAIATERYDQMDNNQLKYQRINRKQE